MYNFRRRLGGLYGVVSLSNLIRASSVWFICLPLLCFACAGPDRDGLAPDCEEEDSCELAEPDGGDAGWSDGSVRDAWITHGEQQAGDGSVNRSDDASVPVGDGTNTGAGSDGGVVDGEDGMTDGAAPEHLDAAVDASASDAALAHDSAAVPDARTSLPDSGTKLPDAGGNKDAGTSKDAGSVVDAAVVAPSGPKLPKKVGTCPEFSEGTATFAGSAVRLWVGDDGETKKGPLVFYWYATNSDVNEVMEGLGSEVVAEIKQMGGMVAALVKTTKTGTNTGNGVWYTGDFAIADEVLACAIEKGVGIDTSHIHAAGFSAGGLQTSWMAYARSNYIASVVPYSGGVQMVPAMQDATKKISAMMVHGKVGEDWFLIDFANTSAAMTNNIRSKGGFAVDCTHTYRHKIPPGIGPSSFRFMKDHGYVTTPSPYVGGLPSGFPSYCRVPAL